MEKNNLFFEKLTPVNDSNISIYEAAIDFVFKNDDVRNIAISGAYGAGKSSVLASYKTKHSSTKFLHICVYILAHNLAQEDMSVLYKFYSEQQAEIQEIIFKNAEENIEDIILSPNTAAISLKERILVDSELALEKRIRLFVAMLPYIGQAEANKYLSALGLHEYVKIFESYSKPKFEINQESENILEAFRTKGWIFEYLEDESRPGYFKIRRNEPRKSENS